MIVRGLAGVTVALGVLASTAPAAEASDDVVAQQALVGTPRGAWQLDEPGTPATAFDSSGFGNHGTNQDVIGTGSGYRFNGTSSRVVVADSPSLDPGTANFSFGVTLVMTTPPTPLGETYDVLRKGIASTVGGEYKLEIKNVKGTARARCVAKDSAKVVVAIVAPTNLADGATHTVTCSKTSTGVSVQIDALTPRTKTVTALGSVSNASALGIGAKAEPSVKTGFDWYLGLIDDAWVRVG
jgi:hypothetical protein